MHCTKSATTASPCTTSRTRRARRSTCTPRCASSTTCGWRSAPTTSTAARGRTTRRSRARRSTVGATAGRRPIPQDWATARACSRARRGCASPPSTSGARPTTSTTSSIPRRGSMRCARVRTGSTPGTASTGWGSARRAISGSTRTSASAAAAAGAAASSTPHSSTPTAAPGTSAAPTTSDGSPPKRPGRSDEGEELVEGGSGVLADEDAVHAEGAGGLDVPGEVVEEDRACRVGHAHALERGVEDDGVGLAHPFLARVDDGVEQLVERELPSPRVAVLPDVVGDDRGLEAFGPDEAHRFHDEAAVDLVGDHHREHLAGVEAESVGLGRSLDPGQRVDEGDLAPLELVPRVVGVGVVGAEHDLHHVRGVDVLRACIRVRSRERRRGEDAAVVPEDGVEVAHVPWCAATRRYAAWISAPR